VTLRTLPGALVLGLLASLAAHTAVYGSGHLVGGSYHDLLLAQAALGVAGMLALAAALAWAGAKHIADGSVLAARLTERLPALRGLAPVTAGWFLLIEHLEPRHGGAPALSISVCLLLAAALLLALARGFLGLLAAAVFAVFQSRHAMRVPEWRVYGAPVPRRTRPAFAGRRFVRPPPSTAIA
jgi:hypothetical protein